MIDPGAKVDKNYHVYQSGTENDVWVKRPNGEIYEGKVWPGYCAFPDFTMPKAREWWSNLYKDFLALGIDGVWNDMNEPAVTDDDIPEETALEPCLTILLTEEAAIYPPALTCSTTTPTVVLWSKPRMKGL